MTDTPTNLVELPQATLTDAAKVLRCIADEIDAGAYGRIEMGALVLQDSEGNIQTFGMAGADWYRGIALFNLGIQHMLSVRDRSKAFLRPAPPPFYIALYSSKDEDTTP